MSSRRKPRGQTGPIRFGNGEIKRELIEFGNTKQEIELQIAQAFCAGNSSVAQQKMRYESFTDLTPLAENHLDFRVQTNQGLRWLELAEFAPLQYFGGNYANVQGTWRTELMVTYVVDLILKKNGNRYGSHVILVIYKTHDTCFIPPTVQQLVRSRIKQLGLTIEIEAIYFLSPHTLSDASVWEIWPGKDQYDNDWLPGKDIHVGF